MNLQFKKSLANFLEEYKAMASQVNQIDNFKTKSLAGMAVIDLLGSMQVILAAVIDAPNPDNTEAGLEFLNDEIRRIRNSLGIEKDSDQPDIGDNVMFILPKKVRYDA